MFYFATVVASGKNGTTHLLTVELDRLRPSQLNQTKHNSTSPRRMITEFIQFINYTNMIHKNRN